MSTSASREYSYERMERWGIHRKSEALQVGVRRVLSALGADALIRLRSPQLEVMFVDQALESVCFLPVATSWAIFRQLELCPKGNTRVVLLFATSNFDREDPLEFERRLALQLGHVLLYLSDGKASHEASDAENEYSKSLAISDSRDLVDLMRRSIARHRPS